MNALEKVLKGKKLSVVFLVLAVLVAAVVVPHLPGNVVGVLDNTAVRIMVMVLIVGVSLVDPVKALLLAIVLVVALMRLMAVKREMNGKVDELIEVSDEISDETSDETSDDAENAFDETEEPESAFDTTGLDETDINAPAESELLNDSLKFNENANNSVNEPVVLGDVPTNSERTHTVFNAVPYNNGVERSEVDLSVTVDRDEKPNSIVIGSLLNEGFENPTDKSSLNNNSVDTALSVDEADPDESLNNTLNAKVPVVEHTLEPVSTEKVGEFTNEWQLQDIGTNLVDCVGNEEKLVSGDALGTQGNSSPAGFSF